MIQSIYIKNFKMFERKTIILDNHNLFIGENDSGKTTILQALDIFFNQEKIDKIFVRNIKEPVEIGIEVNDVFYKKVYSGTSYKLTEIPENLESLDKLKYIYIPAGKYDVEQMIQELAIAKVLENTSEEELENLRKKSQNSIDEVINGIDRDLIVLANDETNIVGEQKFKYEASLKFDVITDGISIEARGLGYQKNLLYALIIGNQYNNVILGIDEIENSFSVNNSRNIIKKIHEKIGQTLITTHSKKILNARDNATVIPLFVNNNTSLIELLESLDDTNNKDYILVEGPYDLNWIKTAVSLLGKANDYYIIPSGGCSNISHLSNELVSYGKKCIIISDGDTKKEKSLKRECIELYAPLNAVNKILELDLKNMPSNKKDFFESTTIPGVRNQDLVKRKISKDISKYITIDNPLIDEIKDLINVKERENKN